MKKPFIIIALLAAITVYAAFISSYPNTATLQSTDLFIVERPGVTNFNISAAQMPGALHVQPTNANLTAWGALTPIGYTNGYPWGSLYDAAGLATAATNGYPWGSLYDAVNAAHNATNGYPWGSLYDAAGLATAATNAFHNGNGLTNLIHSSTVSGVSGVSVALSQNPDGSTNYALTVTAGGSGTVTSVGLSAPGEFTVSGSPVTGAGTLAITRTADANFLGLGGTNIGFLKVTNMVSAGGQVSVSTLVITNGVTNLANLTVLGNQTNAGSLSVAGNATNFGVLYANSISNHNGVVASLAGDWTVGGTFEALTGPVSLDYLTSSTLLKVDGSKTLQSIANSVGVLTNDGAGGVGFNSAPGLNGQNLTNIINGSLLTGTNFTLSFNGSEQRFDVTNGPDVFFTAPTSGEGHTIFQFHPTGRDHVTLHMPYAIYFYQNASNIYASNFDSLVFDGNGSTNFGYMKASILH